MTLFSVDPKTGAHLEMPYQMMDFEGNELPTDETENTRKFESNSKKSPVLYNPRRGFLLESLTNDRLICRARLTVVNSEEGGNEEIKQQDNNIIIQYTSKNLNECKLKLCKLYRNF